MNKPITGAYGETVVRPAAPGDGGMAHLGRAAKAALGRFRDNVVESGRAPLPTLIGFGLAWALFFLILFALPTPPGLSPAGNACLAVVVWACVIWVSEAIPVGISGLLIPMLLTVSGATKTFSQAVGGFITDAAFLCLMAFLLAAIIQAAGLDRRLAISLLHKARVTTVDGVIWVLFAVNLL